jgi:hypothetical protein
MRTSDSGTVGHSHLLVLEGTWLYCDYFIWVYLVLWNNLSCGLLECDAVLSGMSSQEFGQVSTWNVLWKQKVSPSRDTDRTTTWKTRTLEAARPFETLLQCKTTRRHNAESHKMSLCLESFKYFMRSDRSTQNIFFQIYFLIPFLIISSIF